MRGVEMPLTAAPPRKFLEDRHSVALVEFATLFPVLVLLLFGAYDLARGADAVRGLTRLSNSIATMLATNSTGYVNYTNLHYAFDGAAVIFPEVLRDASSKNIAWRNDIGISMAGVGFVPTVVGCTVGCTYVAQIYWTGGSMNRACGTSPVAAADTTPPDRTRSSCPMISSRRSRPPQAAMRRRISSSSSTSNIAGRR